MGRSGTQADNRGEFCRADLRFFVFLINRLLVSVALVVLGVFVAGGLLMIRRPSASERHPHVSQGVLNGFENVTMSSWRSDVSVYVAVAMAHIRHLCFKCSSEV